MAIRAWATESSTLSWTGWSRAARVGDPVDPAVADVAEVRSGRPRARRPRRCRRPRSSLSGGGVGDHRGVGRGRRLLHGLGHGRGDAGRGAEAGRAAGRPAGPGRPRAPARLATSESIEVETPSQTTRTAREPGSGSAAIAVASSLRWCRMPRSQQAATQRGGLLGVVVAFARRLHAAGLAVAVGPDHAAAVLAQGRVTGMVVLVSSAVVRRTCSERVSSIGASSLGRRSAGAAVGARAWPQVSQKASLAVTGAPQLGHAAGAVPADGPRRCRRVGLLLRRVADPAPSGRSSQGPPSHGVGLVDQGVALCLDRSRWPARVR